MKKIKHFFIVACSLFFATAITSCDNEYDLSKDINGEIEVGKNFTVPVGQTVQIPLSRIIKEGDDLTANAETGIYQLSANGEFNSEIASTEVFEINGLSPNFEDQALNLGLDLSILKLSKDPLTVTLPLNTHATYDIELTDTKLPSEVKALYKADFNGDGERNENKHKGAKSIIQIRIPEIDNGTNGIKEIHLEEVHIKFPEIFTLQDENQEREYLHEIYRHDIVLNAENKYTAEIEVYILSVDIPEELQSKYIYTKNGDTYFKLTEGENIELAVEATNMTVVPAEIKSNTIHFYFEYEIDATNITSVNGKVTPDVTVDEQLTLNDLPDFIKDKDSEFTPSDITFNLTMNNPLGLELSTDLTITPYKDGNATGEPVTISIEGNNAIKPTATTKYVISNKEKSVASNETFILCEDLPCLLSPIPDYYKITTGELVADGKNSTGLVLGKNYELTGNYDVDIPFSFSNLTINYTDEEEGLLEDLEDAADLTNKIILNFDVISTIPAELAAEVKLLDINGNELNEITVTGTSKNMVKINASTDGNEVVTPIVLTIEEQDGSTQLEQLDKLQYTIKATNPIGKDVVLKSTQYLIIKNGIAKIPNGITTEL